jgi:hypothetical protein
MGDIAKERPILEIGEWQCASLLRQLSRVPIQTFKENGRYCEGAANTLLFDETYFKKKLMGTVKGISLTCEHIL